LILLLALGCGPKQVNGFYTGAPTGAKLEVTAPDAAARSKVNQEVGFLVGRFRIFKVDLELNQEGDALSGRLKLSEKSNEFNLDFTQVAGSLDGSQVRLEARTKHEGREVVISFAGRAGGDGLAGDLRLNFSFPEIKSSATIEGDILLAGPARSGFGI
jgi:hypothetical protein